MVATTGRGPTGPPSSGADKTTADCRQGRRRRERWDLGLSNGTHTEEATRATRPPGAEELRQAHSGIRSVPTGGTVAAPGGRAMECTMEVSGSNVRAVSKGRSALLLVVIPTAVVAPAVMVLVAVFGFRGSVKGYAIGLGVGVLVAVPLCLALLSVVAVSWVMDRGSRSQSAGASGKPPGHSGVDVVVEHEQLHRPDQPL